MQNPIKTIIVDDEKNGLESLSLVLKEICPELEIVALCNSPKDGLEKINKLKPQLVFLDIEMPFMTGFELLECIDRSGFEVIFTTAYDNYAIKAFKANAIDYLLKPVDDDDLRNAVNKAIDKIKLKSTEEEPTPVLEMLRQLKKEDGNNRLAISAQDGITFVNYDDVMRLSSDSNYTNIYIVNNKKQTVSKTLGDYESLLPKNRFFRIHKNTIVNQAYIEKYVRGEGGYVILKDGSEVEVSRRKKQEFLDWLNI